MKTVNLIVVPVLCIGLATSAEATGEVVEILLSDWESWGDEGAANNSSMNFDLSALLPDAVNGATITGIGWDVTITTLGGSWQSELTLAIGDELGDGVGMFLSPGAGVTTPGTGTYSSNGIIKLSDVAIDDIEILDGIVAIEAFESFDDPNGTDNGVTQDAIITGSITLQVVTNSIPAPGALALLGVAGVTGRRRRRA
jgi:hypothetical protein